MVVHSRDVEDCGGTPRKNSPQKPAKIPYIMMWQHWLGNTKPKKAFTLILNAFKKLLQNFYWTEFSTDWLTNCLPAWCLQTHVTQQWLRQRAWIFLLFDVASAWEVPFAIPLYIQYILHRLTRVLLCVSHSSLFTTKSVDFVVGTW